MSDAIKRLRELGESLPDPEMALELAFQMFEQAPDATVMVDADGSIVLVNKQAELMFGYHRSELLGEKIEILTPGSVRESHVTHRANYAAEPRTRPMGLNLALKARNKAGMEFAVEINLSPVVTRQGQFTIATVRRRNG